MGVAVCKHSFIMLHEGGLGGGSNVDGLDNTLTLDWNPPGLDSYALLSNFLIILFNSVHAKMKLQVSTWIKL